MFCLECNFKSTVVDSRVTNDNIVIRRRKCKSCGCMFYTLETFVEYEDISEDMQKVYKNLSEKRRKRAKAYKTTSKKLEGENEANKH